jgi:hypothetical protein
MESRFNMYGEVANDYPPGFTPPEVREKHRRETEAWIEQMEAPTPSDCSDDGDILAIRNVPRSILCRLKEKRDAAKHSDSLDERDQGNNSMASPSSSTDALEPEAARSTKRRRVPSTEEEAAEDRGPTKL